MLTESFSQAAGRHLSDAQRLLAARRWDNAVYLAGYVVECALKCLVKTHLRGNVARLFGHDLAALQGDALGILRVLHPHVAAWLPASRTDGTVLGDDHPQRRYARSGTYSEPQAEAALERARAIYSETVIGLILDGRLPFEDL